MTMGNLYITTDKRILGSTVCVCVCVCVCVFYRQAGKIVFDDGGVYV